MVRSFDLRDGAMVQQVQVCRTGEKRAANGGHLQHCSLVGVGHARLQREERQARGKVIAPERGAERVGSFKVPVDRLSVMP